MVKSKRKAKSFINYLFSNYEAPRIPVHIHWHHPSLITETGVICFGLFVFDESGAKEIHIAGSKIKTTGVLSSIAHEFVHYLQYLHGRDMHDEAKIEEDAEHYGKCIFGLWLLRERDCSFVKVWEPREDAP